MVRFIIREAKYSAIRGSVLLIGRQTVHLTLDGFSALMREEEMPIDATVPLSLDGTTRGSTDRDLISDAYLFKALGADTVKAIDVSDYEGAEIVYNLDTPVPAELEGKFDFICNGSVLDNMFNPVMGLHNISRMLAPGGRVIHFEHASNATNNAYLQFSPNWFFDYYVVNNYRDCKTYLAFFIDLDGPWQFFACLHDETSEPAPFDAAQLAMTAVIAEKSVGSTWDKCPIQGQYRNKQEWEQYLVLQRHFAASRRPWMSQSNVGILFSPKRGYHGLGIYP